MATKKKTATKTTKTVKKDGIDRNTLIIMILILLIGITAGYVASTYAKYAGEVTRTGTATVAKWAFTSDNTDGALTIDITPTAHASTLVANRIAPGTSGSFNIALSNENTEVGINYEVVFSNLAGVPTNLTFKSGAQGTTEFAPATKKLTGTIVAGGTTTIPINWEWPYQSSTSPYTANDSADTTNGTNGGASGTKMTFTATIKGVQVQPSATAITTSGPNVVNK